MERRHIRKNRLINLMDGSHLTVSAISDLDGVVWCVDGRGNAGYDDFAREEEE